MEYKNQNSPVQENEEKISPRDTNERETQNPSITKHADTDIEFFYKIRRAERAIRLSARIIILSIVAYCLWHFWELYVSVFVIGVCVLISEKTRNVGVKIVARIIELFVWITLIYVCIFGPLLAESSVFGAR